MRRLLILLMVLQFAGFIGESHAEVKWTADARVRPRLDIRNERDYGSTNSDYYYLYRARLNATGDLGDGWFGHIQLGTNGVGYWTGKFGDSATTNSSKPSALSVEGANRGTVDFMLIYFGRRTEGFGYMGGLIPIDGNAMPQYDVHFYSNLMVDVPFYLNSNNAAHGLIGYLGSGQFKINATVLVDNNDGRKIEDSDGNITNNTHDQYTVVVDAPINLGDATVQPMILATFADRGTEAPVTFGGNITSPHVGEFTFSGSFAMSVQRAGDESDKYDAIYFRAKVAGEAGPGTLLAWVDIAKKSWKMAGVSDR